MPKTKLGIWSVVLVVLMPLFLMLGGSLTNSLYSSVPAGNTVAEDLASRPLLAISMMIGVVSGISAFVTGSLAVSKQKEQSPLVYFSIIVGGLLLLFLVGELIFAH